MINSSCCFPDEGTIFEPCTSQQAAECVCVCLYVQVLLLCNEEAVLCWMFKDIPSTHTHSLGVLSNLQLKLPNVSKPEKQTGESESRKHLWKLKVSVLPLTDEAELS